MALFSGSKQSPSSGIPASIINNVTIVRTQYSILIPPWFSFPIKLKKYAYIFFFLLKICKVSSKPMNQCQISPSLEISTSSNLVLISEWNYNDCNRKAILFGWNRQDFIPFSLHPHQDYRKFKNQQEYRGTPSLLYWSEVAFTNVCHVASVSFIQLSIHFPLLPIA